MTSRFRDLARAACAAASAALLACCAGTPSRPEPADAASPRATRHIPLALGQTSTGATPLDHPSPIYPPALQASHLPPQEIEAWLVVDEQGKVSDVRVSGEATAGSNLHQFTAAVREAALRWTFVPWRTHQWAADAHGDAHSVGDQAQPFEVGYLFRFVMNGDVPVVEVHASRP